MFIVADSGSTKTDIALVDAERIVRRLSLPGINPVHLSEKEIVAQLSTLKQEIRRATTGDAGDHKGTPLRRATSAEDPLHGRGDPCGRPHTAKANAPTAEAGDHKGAPLHFYFFGAGCSGSRIAEMRTCIAHVFGISEKSVIVDSDIVGAVLALYGMKPGISCILGTGANSCLCEGGKVIENIPPLGYILGDEGSGAVLGRMFLNALYKGRLQRATCDAFEAWSHLSYEDVISKVYREPIANRFLASLSPFIAEHIDSDPGLCEIVKDNFRMFFRNNIARYDVGAHPSIVGAYPCGRPLKEIKEIRAVGSIAWYYREQLAAVAAEEGYSLGRVLRSPLDGLIEFLQ